MIPKNNKELIVPKARELNEKEKTIHKKHKDKLRKKVK
jgi:hypothetical protein